MVQTHLVPFSLLQRGGISIRVVQMGLVGSFNFQSLLSTLVTSIALLAVSSTIVGLCALNLCPLKALYAQYKTVVTPDLYDLKGLNEAVMARLETEDLINPRPAVLFEAGHEGEGDGKSGVEMGVRTKARGVRVVEGTGSGGFIEMQRLAAGNGPRVLDTRGARLDTDDSKGGGASMFAPGDRGSRVRA